MFCDMVGDFNLGDVIDMGRKVQDYFHDQDSDIAFIFKLSKAEGDCSIEGSLNEKLEELYSSSCVPTLQYLSRRCNDYTGGGVPVGNCVGLEFRRRSIS